MHRAILAAAVACLCAGSGRPVSAQETASLPDGRCAVLNQNVNAGDYLYSELTSPTPCRSDKAQVPLTFDRRTKAPVASEALSSGTYLGSIVLRSGKIFTARDVLQLRFNDGPVAIERQVSPLAPVRAGQSAVFRSQDGETFFAQLVPESAR